MYLQDPRRAIDESQSQTGIRCSTLPVLSWLNRPKRISQMKQLLDLRRDLISCWSRPAKRPNLLMVLFFRPSLSAEVVPRILSGNSWNKQSRRYDSITSRQPTNTEQRRDDRELEENVSGRLSSAMPCLLLSTRSSATLDKNRAASLGCHSCLVVSVFHGPMDSYFRKNLRYNAANQGVSGEQAARGTEDDYTA